MAARDRTLNSKYQESLHPSNAKASFTLFPQLPSELRMKIWTFSLSRNRIIGVSLSKPEIHGIKSSTEEPYSTRNSLGNLISGGRYTLILCQRPRYSALLGTTYESRSAALDFYRIRLPAYRYAPDSAEGQLWGPLDLHFNPEHDVLHIEHIAFAFPEFIDLVCDIKAQDTHGVGLLHLSTYFHKRVIWPGNLLPRAHEAFASVMSTLQSVWLPVILLEQHLRDYRLPLWSAMDSFTCLGQVPREELEFDNSTFLIPNWARLMPSKVYNQFRVWSQIEARCMVRREEPIKLRFLLSQRLVPERLTHPVTEKGVVAYLHELQEENAQARPDVGQSELGAMAGIGSESLISTGTLPSVGFWLLSYRQFMKLSNVSVNIPGLFEKDPEPEPDGGSGESRILPQLCLFELPQGP